MPAGKNGDKGELDLPSITFVKEHYGIEYFDYVGRVEVRQSKYGLGNYVVLVDRKTGEELCEIDSNFKEEFLKHEGKVISFRGKKYHGIVAPHIK